MAVIVPSVEVKGSAKPAAEEVEAVCVPGTGQEMVAESSAPSAPLVFIGVLRDPKVLWTPITLPHSNLLTCAIDLVFMF